MKRMLFCAVLLLPGLALAKRAPSLPVMQFEVQNGAEPRQAALATDAAAESLRDLNVFKVISSDDIKKILSFQRDKALISGKCNEDQCLAEIGGALGADYMVAGKVTKLGGALKLELQLFNNAKSKVDRAVSQDGIEGDTALVDAAKMLAKRVVAPILEKNSGQLFVNVTDQGAAGATVEIDDKVSGITVPPGVQPAPLVLGWGPHHVRVKKEGFLTFEKDVQVDENQSSTLVVTLVPSPDFIDAYRSRNNKLRIFSYVTAGLAVAGGAYAIEQNYENIRLYKAYDAYRQYSQGAAPGKPGINSYTDSNDACAAMVRLTGASGSCSEVSNAAYSQGSSQLTRIAITAGVGMAAAATAITLWVLSDNPHRYDSFIQASPASGTESSQAGAPSSTQTARLLPVIGLSPLPGGVYSSVGLQF
jgi:hypothetical protein